MRWYQESFVYIAKFTVEETSVENRNDRFSAVVLEFQLLDSSPVIDSLLSRAAKIPYFAPGWELVVRDQKTVVVVYSYTSLPFATSTLRTVLYILAGKVIFKQKAISLFLPLTYWNEAYEGHYPVRLIIPLYSARV